MLNHPVEAMRQIEAAIASAIGYFAAQPSIVSIVVSWELCWYRYEVDLGEADAPVRPAGQGYELAELDPTDQQPNAALDEAGLLVLATNPA